MNIKTAKMHLRKHFFFYILLFSIVLVIAVSYYRFLVRYDYIVGYEGVCDPTIEKCFIGHDDTKEYFYSKMRKYEPDLYRECGKNITDCEVASKCLPNDRKCSITFCDKKTDEDNCSIPVENNNNINDIKI